jgi:hypothetical protein
MKLMKPNLEELIWRQKKKKKRKEFKISTKKKEWNKAAGRKEDDFKTTSKCRECKIHLVWKKGGYHFDHKDNNEANNNQRNCYLVCANCHSKATKIKKIKKRNKLTGQVDGYKTIKKKIGYKKPRKKKIRKRIIKRRKHLTFPNFINVAYSRPIIFI